MMTPGDHVRESHRVRVKICGVTNPADAEAAVALGADALGFNFYGRSSRYLPPDIDGGLGWLREVAPFVMRVGVYVNPLSPETACREREAGLVHAVQLHGDEDDEFCRAVVGRGAPMIRALRVQDLTALRAASARFGTREILLDAYRPGAYGGTGHLCDWGLARELVTQHSELRVVLSGGLTPDNVGEAIRQVRPYAVDVASGVEAAGDPRRKDLARLRDFFQAVAGAN